MPHVNMASFGRDLTLIALVCILAGALLSALPALLH